MHPVRPRDVMIQFERVLRSMRSLGYDTTQMQLQIGSATNGVAYRLYQRVLPSHGVSSMIVPDGYLGMTKREAFNTLATIAAALEWARDNA